MEDNILDIFSNNYIVFGSIKKITRSYKKMYDGKMEVDEIELEEPTIYPRIIKDGMKVVLSQFSLN